MAQDDIRMIGQLAMIELHESEQDELAQGIKQMLQYMQHMSDVDLSDVEPTTHALADGLVLRSDTVHYDEDVREALLKEAPERNGSFITIGKVLT